MAKSCKRTILYLNGKRVYRKNFYARNLNKAINHVKDFCFIHGMTVSQEFLMSNGDRLKVVVKAK